MPDQPYVTFPGLAGNYISTPDVNLLDADTAHTYQSIGKLRAVGMTGAQVDEPRAFAGKAYQCTVFNAGDVFIVAGTSASGDGFAISPSTEYAIGVTVLTDRDIDVQVFFEWYNGTTSLGPDYSSPIPCVDGVPNRLQHTATSPATADNMQLSVRINGMAVDDVVTVWGHTLAAGSDASFVPSLRIVGDLDIEADVAAVDWSPSVNRYISTRYRTGAGSQAFLFGVDKVTSPSPLVLYVSYTGSALSPNIRSNDTISLADGARAALRVTYEVDNGSGGNTTSFYVNGQPLGTPEVRAGTSPLFPAAGALEVGYGADGQTWAGDVYRVTVRDGIDGPIVAQFDAADVGGAL